MLKIAVYVSPSKVVKKTTGVGKHTVEMIKALSKENKVSVILFGSYEVENNHQAFLNSVRSTIQTKDK